MKIGVSMLFSLNENFSSLCKRLQEVTLNNIELVDEGWHHLNERRVKRLRAIGRSKGLIYTLHSPFASINIASPDRAIRNLGIKKLKKSMLFAEELDCQLMVFHPGFRTGLSHFYPRLDWNTNIKSVKKLLELARRIGVKIAIENCPEPYGFLLKNTVQFDKFYGEIGENLDLVLDIGHSNINSETQKFIKIFSNRIVHIHVHDNDGKNDLHLGVGFGTINWEQIIEDAKKMNFNGSVIIESYSHIEESISSLKKLLL